jgi:hypothetical protein
LYSRCTGFSARLRFSLGTSGGWSTNPNAGCAKSSKRFLWISSSSDPSLSVCAQRAAGRGEGRIPDYSRYNDFYAMFEGRPQIEVSDDALDVRSAAVRIRQGLDTGLFRAF